MISSASSTRFRSRVGRLALACASTLTALAVACLAAELYFRLRYPPTYTPDPGIVPDQTLGWDSVRPVTPLPLNAGNDLSVLFLGDSFTDRKEWPSEAQRRLRDAGIAIDGFNLGVTGFGTTQELLKLRQHTARLAPRAVVLLFFAWNDLRDNYPYPELAYGPQRASRPYLRVSDGATRVQAVPWTSALHSSLLGSEVYLRIVNRAMLRFNKAVFRWWPNLPSRLGWRAWVYYEEPVSWHPFYQASRASSPYVKGAYEVTMAAFRGIRDLAATRGAPLLVIGIDNAFTVDAEVADHFVKPFPDLDTSLPLARIAQLLESDRIAFVNAQPELLALREQTGRPVYSGPAGGLGIAGHLHPEADRLIGTIAARWLAEHLAR
ncbi:MAG: hypothetical protein ACRD2N_02845 [Vicinamibacterales bacterium]